MLESVGDSNSKNQVYSKVVAQSNNAKKRKPIVNAVLAVKIRNVANLFDKCFLCCQNHFSLKCNMNTKIKFLSREQILLQLKAVAIIV